MRALPALATLFLVLAPVLAQESNPSTPAPPALDTKVQIPPALLLGQRIVRAHDVNRVIPHLVLVKDSLSYRQAVAAWTPIVRFPILIDDGLPAAAEDIGRFARAFKPLSIVAWSASAPEGADLAPLAEFAAVTPASITSALAQSWGLPPDTTPAAYCEALKKLGRTPPGVVVMRDGDPAWAGGLALAAGRGQPIIWAPTDRLIDQFFTIDMADDYCAAIETQVSALPLAWRALGDEIDAVTLATNAGAKLDKGGHDFLAMTDRVGRLGKGTEVPERWAWAGQVHGSARESVYRAMCSLFLTHGSVFLFDGYPTSAPWNAYDATKAADAMKNEMELKVEVIDSPKGSAAEWRARAARPLDADLVFITTKGNADFFDLEPGQCKPGDVPILTRPSAVHIVHSWSALFPGLRDLLAGRWMERGAYFYVGSVHEPYLSAFLPTPMLTVRMFSGAPWGAAVRHDGGPCWKIAVFGDPLTIATRVHISTDVALPLAGAVEVQATLREDLKTGRIEAAFRTLVLQGRDSDVARIAASLLKDKRGTITPAAAELAILPLFRAKAHADIAPMYALLDAPRAKSPPLRDALWHAAYPRLTAPGEEWVNVLRVNLRPDQLARDATALAAAISRTKGKPQADAYLTQVRDGLTDKAQQDALDAALKLPEADWGK